MINSIKTNLVNRVSPQLYNHIMGVTQTAKDLAKYYNVDEQACEIAALLHDYAKQDDLNYNQIRKDDQDLSLENAPAVWHGYIASYIAEEEYQITNPEILSAIKYHTSSHPQLGEVGKILYIADTIEPNRDFPGIEQLRAKEATLDQHYQKVFTHCLKYLNQKGIAPTKLTLDTAQEMGIHA